MIFLKLIMSFSSIQNGRQYLDVTGNSWTGGRRQIGRFKMDVDAWFYVAIASFAVYSEFSFVSNVQVVLNLVIK